ncbi:MAG: decarboxylating 6-phosphogluconate dehydrogenase [Rhodothermales bacterium]|nr:decarboxylating 6-phosphogluconate dehydrogenase [Rhodothermales bacterium]
MGLVGLGRMGAGMARRLRRAGHQVTGYDPSSEASVASLAALVDALPAPRHIWVMVPAGAPTRESLDELARLLGSGDHLVDGGNSHYVEAAPRAARLAEQGVDMLDVGTSGGVLGEEHGYSLMVGGSEQGVAAWRPVLEALAPSPEKGWAHVGASGAGHFAKMIHNGIEYGMMQAIAEGVAVMQADGEPRVDVPAALHAWRSGSIVSSMLLDLTEEILGANPALSGVGHEVADSGEGRWAVAAAIERDVAAPVITQALLERLRSRDEARFADRLLAAMRGGFGGHHVPDAS